MGKRRASPFHKGGGGVEEIGISTEHIRLQDLLKLARAVDTGGEAKTAVQAGEASVNGETCVQRGRKLRPGDTVSFRGRTFRVVLQDCRELPPD